MAQIVSGRATRVSTQDEDTLSGLLATWGATLQDKIHTPGITNEQKEALKSRQIDFRKQKARMEQLHILGVNGDATDGYLSMLNPELVTGRSSIFTEAVADTKAELANMAQAYALGANPVLVSTMQQAKTNELNAADQARIASATAGAYKKTYSWSNLHTWETNPDEWYRRYVLGKYPTQTRETFLGTAIDQTLGEWARKKLAVQKGEGEMPDGAYFEKYFTDTLYKNKELYPLPVESGNEANYTPKQVERFKNTLQFARQMSTM